MEKFSAKIYYQIAYNLGHFEEILKTKDSNRHSWHLLTGAIRDLRLLS